MTMKPALLHGYIICDSDGRCQAHTLATNRSDCWRALIVKKAALQGERVYDESAFQKRKRELKRQGFRAARVWVTDAEVKL